MRPRIIGRADEFYRLRVVRVDESDFPDLEWREDILWRRPRSESVAEAELYRVEAVESTDEDAITPLAAFDARDEAYEWCESALIDLAEMTKSEFENTYFPESAQQEDVAPG